MTDPYLIPGTDVLSNLAGCTTAAELEQSERLLTAIRIAELDHATQPGVYDLDHLQSFHRRIFQDVYSWAGSLRTVEIEKDGITFCFARHLSGSADDILRRLPQVGYLVGLPRPQLVARLAEQFGDLNQLHPFREGNGRATRAFLRQLLREAGWDINWSDVLASCGSVAWVGASRAAAVGNLDQIKAVLSPHVMPT